MSQPWRKLRPRFASLNDYQLTHWLEAAASETAGLLGAVTKVVREIGEKQPLVVIPLAVLVLSWRALAVKAQTVITFPIGFSGDNGHITLVNPLVGGSIRLVLGQSGWIF